MTSKRGDYARLHEPCPRHHRPSAATLIHFEWHFRTLFSSQIGLKNKVASVGLKQKLEFVVGGECREGWGLLSQNICPDVERLHQFWACKRTVAQRGGGPRARETRGRTQGDVAALALIL